MHSSSGHQATRRHASLLFFWTRLKTHPFLSRLRIFSFNCNLHSHIQRVACRIILIYHGLPSYSNCAPKTSSLSIEPRTTGPFSAYLCLPELTHFRVLNRTGCHIFPLYFTSAGSSFILYFLVLFHLLDNIGQLSFACSSNIFCASNNSIYLTTRMSETCYLGLQTGTW